MAFLLVSGVPGTGKTLYCIQRYIIPELKKGGVVYTNIEGLIARRISFLFDVDIFDVESNLRQIDDPQYFYKDLPKNCMIILDESQNIFSNRDWQSKHNNEAIKYLMEHRHYGHKVVFITPSIDSLDAGMRRIVEFTYKHKSFSALGSATTVKCGIYDQCNMAKGPLQTITWKHDSRIYDCYSSYFSDGTKEQKPRVHPLRNSLLIFVTIFAIVMLSFSVYNLSKLQKKVHRSDRALKNRSPSVNDSIITTKGLHRAKIRIQVNDSVYTVYDGESSGSKD